MKHQYHFRRFLHIFSLKACLCLLLTAVAAFAAAQFADSRNNLYSIYYIGDFRDDSGDSVLTDMNEPKGSSDELWFTGYAEAQAGVLQPLVWRQTVNGPRFDALPLESGYEHGKSLAIESLIPVGMNQTDIYQAVGARKRINGGWEATRWRKLANGSLIAQSLHKTGLDGWSESWLTGITYDTVKGKSIVVGEFVMNGTRQAFLQEDGPTSEPLVLQMPEGCDRAVARQIRNGRIVGSSFDFNSGFWRATLWKRTGEQWIPQLIGMANFPSATNSYATSVNIAGDVVGTVYTNGGTNRRGFLFANGVVDAVSVPDLSGSAFNAAIYSINDAGWMVGESRKGPTGPFVPMLIYRDRLSQQLIARTVSDSPVDDGYGGELASDTPDFLKVDNPEFETKVGYSIGAMPLVEQLPPLALTGSHGEKRQALMVRAFLSTNKEDGIGIGKVSILTDHLKGGGSIAGFCLQVGRTNGGEEGPLEMNEDKVCTIRFTLETDVREPEYKQAVMMYQHSSSSSKTAFKVPLHWSGGRVTVTPRIPGFFGDTQFRLVSIDSLNPIIAVDSVQGKQVGDNVTLRAKLSYPGLDQKYIDQVSLTFEIYLNGKPFLNLGQATTDKVTGVAEKQFTIPASIGIGVREIRVTSSSRLGKRGDDFFLPGLNSASGVAPMTLQSNTVITVPTIPAAPGTTIELNAQLAYQGAPTSGIAGQTLSFTVDGQAVGSAVTDFAGVARIPYKVPVTQQTDLAVEVTFDSQISDLLDPPPGIGVIDVNLSEFLWLLRQSLISNCGLSYQSTNNNWGGQYVLEGSVGEPIVFTIGGDATYNAETLIRAGFWQAALAIPWLPDFIGIGR